MATLSDREVIIRVKQGEIDLFSHVVKKFGFMIERFIKSRLFNKDESDDLVQNTFISFYKAVSKFDENLPVLPYLYQIARNELKMYYRSFKKTVPLIEEITIAEKEEILFDENMLKTLGTEEKKLLLEIADGYSYEEVAKKYRISVNTLKSKVRRARIKLRSVIPSEVEGS